MSELPGIGRNGLINSVRRLSGGTNPGYRKVSSSASFIAGQVAALGSDANGNPVLEVANATSKKVVGIFFCHKTSVFYQPVVCEAQTFGAGGNTAFVVYLNHANLKSGSIVVEDVNGTDYTVTTDYTVNTTNGTITRTSTGFIGATDTIYVTYMYQDMSLTGIDQTLGSGCAATIEDFGELATLVYDTSVAYSIMAKLYSDANGYLTTTSGGGAVVGYVTKVPTVDDPELHFKLSINNA